MFARFVAAVERHARWIIGAWVVAAVVLTIMAPSLNDVGSQDTADFLPASAPSQKADKVLARLFPNDPTRDAAILVFARDTGLTDTDHAYIGQLATYLGEPAMKAAVKDVQTASTSPDLGPFLRSPDGKAELAIVSFTSAPFTSRSTTAIGDLRSHLAHTAPPGLVHHVTGIAGLAADQANGVVQSFGRTAIVTVVLVLVILLLIYRSAVAPLIPLLTIALAFAVSNGAVSYAASAGLKVSTMVGTFLVVMVFGAGTDYCLFLTSRYREELARGDDVATTVRRTTKVIAAVIAASAATVIVGFSSMITADFGIFKTMGPAVGIAIAITLLAGVTLTPALLRVANTKIFWPRALDDVRQHGEDNSRRWVAVASLVQRRPAEILLACVIALQLPAAGLGWYHQSFNLVSDLPRGADARDGYNTVAAHYPGGMVSPVYLVIQANGPILDDGRVAAIDKLTDALRAQPGVGEVRSITQPAGAPLTMQNLSTLTGGSLDPTALGIDPNQTDITPFVDALASPQGLRLTGPLLRQYPQITQRMGLLLGTDGNSTRFIIAPAGNPYDNNALDTIEHIDDTAGHALAGTALTGSAISVGGPSSFYADMREISNNDFRVICAVIIGAIFIVLALLLRSIVAPFYLLATVVLSYAATMGITVIVFQGILGDPGITFWLAPFLFVILVALGADYNIFIMSRVREEADAGHEIHDAVTRGLTLTGRVITSAGFILAGTFLALIVAPLPNLRQIGFGVTVGILIDTFLVRSLLVPSATMLLGKWAFWPRIPATDAVEVVPRPVRRRRIGIAVAGVTTLTLILTAVAVGGHTPTPVTVVNAAPAAQVAAPTTTTAADGTAGAALVAVTQPVAASPATEGTTPTTAATATPAPQPDPPSRIVAPRVGTWQYHVTGNRTIGAGQPSPIDENATTDVTRTGGTDDTPEMRVLQHTSTYTRDDARRYGTDGVTLLATQFSASGAQFGGPLDPPQLLVRWPLTIGDTWSGRSTAGSLTVDGTGTVTGERDVTTPIGTFHCWDVQLDATISGSVSGEQHDKSCWVPELGLPVESHQQLKGTYNGIPFAMNLDFNLVAVP